MLLFVDTPTVCLAIHLRLWETLQVGGPGVLMMDVLEWEEPVRHSEVQTTI